MLYVGCDVHRNYTTMSVINEAGVALETKDVPNSLGDVESLLRSYPEEEFAVVLEAGLNWGMIYDLFESLDQVQRVVLAHPPRVKAIASAKIKTDKIDARTLGQLLRADLIPEVWVPPREVRVLKEVVRFRAFVVKVNTMLKNRIHDLLRRAHISAPEVKDLFGSFGRRWLDEIKLPDEREDRLLRQHLALHVALKEEEHQLRVWLGRLLQQYEELRWVKTIPGIGDVFAAVILLEIGDINRFPDAAHLHAYCGLVPTTHVSGQIGYHGRLIRGNRWLRWAFVEGAHTSIRVSPYFQAHYYQVKGRAGTQAASIACARKLATVTYKVLKEKRPYREIYASNNESRSPSVRSSQVSLGSCPE